MTIALPGEPAPTGYERSCAGGPAGSEHGRAIRDVLDRVGDKWSLLVIGTLGQERRRFTELQRHIPGISQRMLTLTLRQLERDGLITRTVHAEVPPRVEYELTALGGTLIALAMELADWAIQNHPRIETARAAYDEAHPR
ncbi:helix-turn-helix domain-containing protein [Microbacter sp. GSS18]|nr:helix-turn-helix domain-containing protein [Microbacter sp. GSS18]